MSFKLPLKEHSGIFIPLTAFLKSYVNVTFHIIFYKDMLKLLCYGYGVKEVFWFRIFKI